MPDVLAAAGQVPEILQTHARAQQSYSRAGDRLASQVDGGQGRRGEAGRLDVVEAGQGHVVGHLDAAACQDGQHADGHDVVEGAAVSGSTAPDIDALRVQGIPGTDGVALVGSASNRCADIDKNTIVNGTQAQIWDCSGGSNETFTQTSRGELVVYGNKCLDADNNDTINGTKVIISDCTGGTNQKWTVNSGSTITNNLSGLCLDATNAATANGTKLLLWTCNGQTNQKWTLN